jgi:hypothetical protein
MYTNCLLLSPTKTTVRIFHQQKIQPANIPQLTLSGELLEVGEGSLKWLGVDLDSSLSMTTFVREKCRSCFFQLRMIRSIRKSLDEACTRLLCNALVVSRLDYAISLLVKMKVDQLHKLRRVLHLAARTVKNASRQDHIRPLLIEFKWCPMEWRPTWKLLCMVEKSLRGTAPEYLIDQLEIYVPKRSLRSGNVEHLTLQTSLAKKRVGESAFSVAGPQAWNSLPHNLRILPKCSSFSDDIVNYYQTLE